MELSHLYKALSNNVAHYRFDHITVHCSASRPKYGGNVQSIREGHLLRKFSDVGYHVVITRDGEVQLGRPLYRSGAHVQGHNAHNLGVCLVGGLNNDTGEPEDNFTDAQKDALRAVLSAVSAEHKIPQHNISGHRDWFPDANGDGVIDSRDWLKVCPCFDVQEFLNE